jgi:hypothetical protein
MRLHVRVNLSVDNLASNDSSHAMAAMHMRSCLGRAGALSRCLLRCYDNFRAEP